jgi:hypothetical protein
MEWGTLPAFFVPPSLYVQLPTQMQAIEAPFDVFANGLLFSVTWIVLRARRRVLPWTRWLYLILAVGALAGYSTFHLVGFVLVIAPVLALVPPHRGGRRLVAFAAAGVGALVLAAPLLWEFAHRRGHAVLVPGQLPLYLWVWHHPLALLLRALLGLAFLLVLQNLLGFWAVFAHAPRSAWTRGLRAIFLWGCVTCLWGDQNYVLKMGTFISLAGLARRRELALASLCLLGPGLLLLNQIRANFMVEPVDPIWTVLDRITAHSSEMVYYSCDPQSNQKLQPYFSHARFLGPVERLDSQYTVILSDLTALPALPPWPQRVRRLDPGATTVLRLDSPPVDPVPPAVRIYLDPRYSLSREPLPAP